MVSNFKYQKTKKILRVAQEEWIILKRRLLATVTLFIIVVHVAMKANDLLSPSVPPLSSHNMAVASHIDMEKFTDKEECIKYCDESCADLRYQQRTCTLCDHVYRSTLRGSDFSRMACQRP